LTAPIKRHLLAPGPTPVPERVALAMARPALYHRAPEFAEVLLDCVAKLRLLFKTAEPVVLLSASATGGMEAAVANLLGPGDAAVVVRGGKFGERWGDLCSAYGVPFEAIDVEWGRSVDPASVDAALAKRPDAKALLVTASETSTGVRHPVEALGPICRARGALLVVDGVTAVGCFDVPMDAWGIDCMVVGSQKALMLPPGLTAVALSARAREALERSKHPRYYFDLRKELKNHEKGQTAFTPATSLVVGLREALTMIEEEGLDNVFARHARLAHATREGARALGLELFADRPTPACTAIRVPAGVDGSALVKRIRERWGVTIAGGQDRLKGKIIRLAHLGWAAEFDTLIALAAVELGLADLGHPVQPGAGVGAAETALRAS